MELKDRWFYRLARWIWANHPERVRVISDRNGENPYLVKFYLFGHQESKWLSVALHLILMSDDDGLHDHPWVWASIGLHGAYWEDQKHGRTYRRPGRFRLRSPHAFHRLDLDPTKGQCWTLFIMGPHLWTWGFLSWLRKRTRWIWVHHDEHFRILALRRNQEVPADNPQAARAYDEDEMRARAYASFLTPSLLEY